MNSPYKIWSITFDGKTMHINFATRLPRKLKKMARSLYNTAGDEHDKFVIVSPNFEEMMEGTYSGEVSATL